MSEIESKFKIFDKTGDGFITKDEVGYVIRSMGFAPTDGQVNECIKKCAADLGKISTSDVQKMISSLAQPDEYKAKTQLLESFQVFDVDNSGMLAESDVRFVLGSLGEKTPVEDLDRILSEVSIDNRGRINIQSLVDTLMRVR